MEDTGLIDLKIRLRDYSHLFLTHNPFPAVGVPEDYPRITVDRESIKKRFQNVISEILSTGGTIITVMVGDYGSGKSHLLKLFKHSVNRQLLAKEEKTLAVYVKSPGEDFSDLLFSVVDDIGKNLMTEQARAFLLKELYAIKGYRDLIHDPDVLARYLSNDASLDEILKRIELITLFNRIRREKFTDIRSSDVVFAFLNLACVDNSTKAWRWFLGQNLKRDEMSKINVEQQISANNAYAIFLDLLKTLRSIGIKYLVLLIDELEKITLLTSTKRAKYQDQLRQMIDDNPNNVCFYFGMAPKQWRDLTSEPTALVRRLSANWHVLDEFKKVDAKALVQAYLFSTRTPDYSAEKIEDFSPKCDPSIFPFTDEAISRITKKSEGIVSNIISLARKALEILLDSTGEQVITAELIDKIKPGLIH